MCTQPLLRWQCLLCVRVCAGGLPPHLANGCAHPGAVVVKPLNAVVVHRAVVCTRGLVKVARLVVADDHLVPVHQHVLGPAGRTVKVKVNVQGRSGMPGVPAVRSV